MVIQRLLYVKVMPGSDVVIVQYTIETRIKRDVFLSWMNQVQKKENKVVLLSSRIVISKSVDNIPAHHINRKYLYKIIPSMTT